MDVKTGRNQNSPAHAESRKKFFDWLAYQKIQMDGIHTVERDKDHDNEKLTSAGIRLRYEALTTPLPDLKDGILLEAGFDDVTPNVPTDISSWMYDHAAASGVDLIDNRARGVAC